MHRHSAWNYLNVLQREFENLQGNNCPNKCPIQRSWSCNVATKQTTKWFRCGLFSSVLANWVPQKDSGTIHGESVYCVPLHQTAVSLPMIPPLNRTTYKIHVSWWTPRLKGSHSDEDEVLFKYSYWHSPPKSSGNGLDSFHNYELHYSTENLFFAWWKTMIISLMFGCHHWVHSRST